MKRLISLLLVIMLLLGATAMAEYDPIIVQVGPYTYPRSLVLSSLRDILLVYEQAYGTVTDEDMEEIKKQVIDKYVQQGVMENMLHELELDVYSAEDIQRVEKDAKVLYDQTLEVYVEQIVAQYGCSEEKARKYVPDLMDLDGMNMEAMRERAVAQIKQERLTDYANQNVDPLTNEELETWYQENLVAPCREAYAKDIAAFEQEVIYGGAVTYYIPEGYRNVQCIVLPADEESQEAAYLLQKELENARDEAAIAQRSLEGYELLMEDTTEAKARLTEAQNRITSLEKELLALYKKMAEPYADVIAEIKTRLRAGEDFMTLMAEYDQNTDPQEKGYPVCVDSVLWEDAFRDAAMSMTAIGDHTGVVLTGNGPVFLYYESDVTPGAVAVEDWQELRELAQEDARQRRLESVVQEWKKYYIVLTAPEKLIVR